MRKVLVCFTLVKLVKISSEWICCIPWGWCGVVWRSSVFRVVCRFYYAILVLYTETISNLC